MPYICTICIKLVKSEKIDINGNSVCNICNNSSAYTLEEGMRHFSPDWAKIALDNIKNNRDIYVSINSCYKGLAHKIPMTHPLYIKRVESIAKKFVKLQAIYK